MRDRGHEQRRPREPGMRHDFRQVFVRQIEPVQLERRTAVPLVRRDHGRAAAAVAADGVDAERRIGGDQPCIDQRSQQRDRAGGVAARVRHPVCRRDAGRLIARQFRKTICPARRGAVGGAGVEDFGHGTRKGDGAAGRIVGQAQDYQVGGLHGGLPCIGGFTFSVGERDQGDRGHARESVGDLEAGGAGLAVDEDAAGHGGAGSGRGGKARGSAPLSHLGPRWG